MEKRTKQILQTILFFAIGIFLVVYQIKGLSAQEMQQVSASFKQANLFWILFPMGVALLSHFVRALRWKLLIDTAGKKVRLHNTFFAVMIGYLANGFLPRLGELIRCGVLGKKEEIKFETLVGTMVAERIFDFILMVVVIFITIMVQYEFLFNFLEREIFQPLLVSIKANRSKYIFGFLAIVLVLFIIYFFLDDFLRTFSAKMAKKYESIRESFTEGMTTILKLKQKGLFVAYSFFMWACYFFMSFFVFNSLKETKDLGIDAGLSVLTSGSLGLVVPTPGGLGSYHQLVSEALQLYGVTEATGISLSWLIWLTNFSVILIFGLLSLLFINLKNKQNKT